MIPCSAAEICLAVGGTLLQDADAAVTNVSTDSRTAAAGDLFIPLVGEKFDGHAYLDGALARGAAGCAAAVLCGHRAVRGARVPPAAVEARLALAGSAGEAVFERVGPGVHVVCLVARDGAQFGRDDAAARGLHLCLISVHKPSSSVHAKK